jgi:glutathione synthase
VKLGLVINDLAKEHPEYTTMLVARNAHGRGHEVWIIEAEDLGQGADGTVHALARRARAKKVDAGDKYLKAIKDSPPQRVSVDALDILWLRNDPAEDMDRRPWVSTAAILFGQLAVRRGVVVLNDPFSLSNALNKTYFQHVPEEARPRTLITRDPELVKAFIVDDLGGDGVIKPLQGSGGRNVFVVRGGDTANINQMIEAVSRDGYVVAQEYLREAKHGDVRLFVMNGKPLEHDGVVAVMRRVNPNGDARSNMHAGGKPEKVEMTEEIFALSELVRPMLVKDGMFLVGLDIVGDKLMEVNVFSPGGLSSCSRLYGTPFAQTVVDALERKVAHKHHYAAHVGNLEYATL